MSDGPLKVLFVCAMNKRRSVTAERLYRNDPRLRVRSAGVRAEAKRRVSEADLKWADIVFVMDRAHRLWITTHFNGLPLPPIDVLDVPDEFEVMDPELQAILRSLLDAELDHLLTNRPRDGAPPCGKSPANFPARPLEEPLTTSRPPDFPPVDPSAAASRPRS